MKIIKDFAMSIHKIIIPTDFTVDSLFTLKYYLNKAKATDVFEINLLHGYVASNSITELLFTSERMLKQELISQNFHDACAIIKNKYSSQIKSLQIKLYSGNTVRAMKNFIEANAIDTALLPINYPFKKINVKSFDVMPFIKKCGINFHEIHWDNEYAKAPINSLSGVFSTSQYNKN